MMMINLLTFNFYYSLEFWFWFAAIVILFRVSSVNLFMRNLVLMLCSIIMLLALPRFGLSSLVFLVILSLLTFSIGRYLNRHKQNKYRHTRLIISAISICVILLVLAFFKYSAIQAIYSERLLQRKFEPSDLIFIIGISYISFKMMHFIIEAYKKQLSNNNLLNYLNYVFYFPSFISGPINRYNHFSDQLSVDLQTNLAGDLRVGLTRIIHGLFKKFVLCTLLYTHTNLYPEKSLLNLNWLTLFSGLYATSLYFYFDFSAYSDIAIGSSRILGIELPENFNNPFLKKNLQQLWANWHISLTSWLTDYIYWPVSKKLRNIDYFKNHPVLLSNISIIITFIVCGMWHGDSLNFVIWGLYHGIGLAVLKIYQTKKRAIKNKYIRKYFVSTYSQTIGALITFHYFVFGMLFFTFDISKIIDILSRLV